MPVTSKFGLLGHPLGHSFSRQFHNNRFAELGIDAVYCNYDLEEIGMLPGLLRQEPDLLGLNVTIPYKQAVMQYLDELDPLAERIGAVNVIRVRRLDPANPSEARLQTRIPGFSLKGFNSDIVGFSMSLKPMLHEAGIKGGKALILGTGGASKAVFVGLQELGLEPTYVSRTAGDNKLSYAQLTPEIVAGSRVIVNCTPLGMFPNVDTCPDLPYEALTAGHVCFDCVYNPAETLFMKKSAQQGAAVKSGYDMLVGQAIESYRIWTES